MVPTALWIVPVADLGGVARHTLDALGHGIPGWRTVLLTPPGPLADAAHAAGIAVLATPFGPERGVPASLRAIRDAVARLRPALVHSHLAYADIAAALAVPRGIPLVCTEHGIAADDRVYHAGPMTLAMMLDVHRARLLLRRPQLIAVSQATADQVRRKWRPRDPITVIRNGIDAGPARPAGPPPQRPQRPPAVLSLARLSPEKRLGELIEAFAVLHRRRPGASLTVAGEGPLAGSLRTQVERLRLSGAVHFPGYRPAGALLAEADVLVQLSVWENCSYAVLDALRAGVGVVATAVGGNPEMLPPRCLIPDPTDSQAVADAIEAQLDPTGRPTLPPGWPSVADMCAQLAAVYQGSAVRDTAGRR